MLFVFVIIIQPRRCFVFQILCAFVYALVNVFFLLRFKIIIVHMHIQTHAFTYCCKMHGNSPLIFLHICVTRKRKITAMVYAMFDALCDSVQYDVQYRVIFQHTGDQKHFQLHLSSSSIIIFFFSFCISICVYAFLQLVNSPCIIVVI